MKESEIRDDNKLKKYNNLVDKDFKKFFKLAYYKRLVKYGLLTTRFYVRVALKRVSASLNKEG